MSRWRADGTGDRPELATVTIIIGGLIQDRKDKSSRRIPILGSLPLLGPLFRHDSETVVNTETVVFMTPRIISGNESFLRARDMKKTPEPLRTMDDPGAPKQPKPVR